MKVVIGSDAAGFHLKEFIRQKLEEAGPEVSDVGTQDPNAEVRYMYAADRVAKALQAKEAERGFVFCGTGMGVSICANKHKGVYCALVESQWAAYNARFINNANILALGERIVAPVMAWDIVQTFLNTQFHEGAAPARAAGLTALFDALCDVEQDWFPNAEG